MHRIECSNCRHRLKYGDEHVGKKAKCQKCGHSFRLPAGRAAPAAVAPVAAAEPATPPPARPDANRTVNAGASGAMYAETSTALSSIHGDYRSDQLGCEFVLSADGRRVFHTGGPRGLFGTLMGLMEGQANYALDGRAFHPKGFTGVFQFSPDGRHYAYTASRERGFCLVLDERDVSDCYPCVSRPVLSTGAAGWAFTTQLGKKWHVVHNGQVGAAFDAIEGDSLEISADGRAVGYFATRGRQKLAVLAGQEVALQEQAGSRFSKDGKHTFAFERSADGRCVCVDGRPGPSFDKIDEASLSYCPEGERVAYAARRDGKWHVVREGEVGPPFAAVGQLIFSPDGRRFAYAACTQKSWLTGWADWRVVLDGADQPVYQSVGHLTFAPGGDRFAYSAAAKGGTRLVLDGAEQGNWEAISAVVFSPDGRRHLYLATTANGTRKRLVLDGEPGQPYPDVGEVGFSPDGRHVVAMAVGEKYSEPTPSFWSGEVKRSGGFLLLDNDYESRAWISSASTQFGIHHLIRIGFAGPRGVYAVSMAADRNSVSFGRVDVEWC